ncbi:MAG: hypothetical protein JWM68_2046 [Verrucomicrobiales bacterium]|nr:hypothetical protein [Verrucomicrobiales bacterium]
MKMLPKLTLITCLFCILSKTLADDKIERYFGLKLGDFFAPATAVSTNSPGYNADMPRELEYGVVITNAIKPFDSLFVQITPKTHKIYRIIARGDKVTDREKKDVKADLREKFATVDKATRQIKVGTVMTGGDRSIDGSIIPKTNTTEMWYTALDLQNIALKEVAEQKSLK